MHRVRQVNKQCTNTQKTQLAGNLQDYHMGTTNTAQVHSIKKYNYEIEIYKLSQTNHCLFDLVVDGECSRATANTSTID